MTSYRNTVLVCSLLPKMSALYEWLGLAFDIFVTAYLVKLHRKFCRTLNNIKTAPSVDIGPDLVSLIQSHKNASSNEVLPYAIVRGRVTEINDSVLSSTGLKGVVQIITLHEITAKRFRDSWDTDNVPPVSETRNSVPFALKPICHPDSNPVGQITVEVEDPFGSIWESLLIPSSSCFTPTNSFSHSVILDGIASGKILGIRKTERFLPVETIVTGIGRIVQDPQTGQLKLQEPSERFFQPYMLTTLPIEELISKFEFRKYAQRAMIAVSISLGLIIVGRRVTRWWSLYKMTRLRESILKERKNMNLDNLCRCQTCLVCLVNPREVILLHCGHVCICADCFMKVNGMCPICRQKISHSHKAYIA